MEKMSTNMVPDELHPNSELFILLQNPGADEERLGIPACGKTGQVLNTQYIPLSGLQRGSQISVGNVLRCRLGASNSLPSGEMLAGAVEHCQREYYQPPRSTTGIVTQGKLAFDYAKSAKSPLLISASSTPGTVTSWRGFLLPSTTVPTFVTIHTADTFRDPIMSWVSELDWRHIGALRGAGWVYPAPPPQLRASPIGVEEETRSLFNRVERGDCRYIVIDTEFIPNTKNLRILGLGFQYESQEHSGAGGWHAEPKNSASILLSQNHALPHNDPEHFHVLSLDWARLTYPVKDWFKVAIKQAVSRVPSIFQNAFADIPQLKANLGIEYEDYVQVEDTMLAHAVLWCELPHTLDFLASVYGKYGKFKHLQGIDEIRYNYGDVVDTHLAWQALAKSFEGDRQAEAIYREQSLKLIPVLLKAAEQGIRVNTKRVLEVFEEYHGLINTIREFASLTVGYPINLNSGQQLKYYLYGERGLPLQLDKETKRATTDDDAIARLRRDHGPIYDTSKELTWDRDDEKSYSVLRRIEAGADPILESRALWAGAWQTVNNYIVGLGKGVYGERNKGKRKKARESYWKDGFTADAIVHRIYPNFAIHAQKTGRWSTTEPPLAQLPSDLRDIITSDEEEVCVSWDWSAIEPRVLQALTGSALLKRTFDDNFDLHTWTVCYMFGYDMPPDLVDPHRYASCEEWRRKYNWQGKDDPRRVFAKQGRYEIWYGGSGSNAAAAAAQFGLNATDLRVALSKLASSDPAYYAWKVRTEAEVKKTSLIRTFMGRPRRFLSQGDSRRREGLDQPMQGAVSDIFNTTVVLLSDAFPMLRWGWGMHDSQKWYIKRRDLTPALLDSIKQIVERVHVINGQETRFPADLEVILPPEQDNLKLTPAEYFALV
jgi:uracil-DNA glycosylase family 4